MNGECISDTALLCLIGIAAVAGAFVGAAWVSFMAAREIGELRRQALGLRRNDR